MEYELGIAPFFQFITPGATLAEMETIQSLSSQLGRDIAASKVPDTFKQSFASYYREWLKYYESNKDSWLARGTTTTYNKVLDYKKRLETFRADFITFGGKTTSESPSGAGIAPTFPLKTMVVIAGVATGMYVLVKEVLKKGNYRD